MLNYRYVEGILPKRPYPSCLRMADRALLAGYPWGMDRELSYCKWALSKTQELMTSWHGFAICISNLLWEESTGHLWIILTKGQLLIHHNWRQRRLWLQLLLYRSDQLDSWIKDHVPIPHRSIILSIQLYSFVPVVAKVKATEVYLFDIP